jgi:hypothetical protein
MARPSPKPAAGRGVAGPRACMRQPPARRTAKTRRVGGNNAQVAPPIRQRPLTVKTDCGPPQRLRQNTTAEPLYPNASVPGSSSGLGHRPLTAKITGSNPVPGTIPVTPQRHSGHHRSLPRPEQPQVCLRMMVPLRFASRRITRSLCVTVCRDKAAGVGDSSCSPLGTPSHTATCRSESAGHRMMILKERLGWWSATDQESTPTQVSARLMRPTVLCD